MKVREFDLDDEYERLVMREFKLDDERYGLNRELGPSGTNTPVAGIFSLGWNDWRNLPAADFVKELIDWQVGFYRDHSSEPFFPNSKPVANGELSWDELVTKYTPQIALPSHWFEWEPLAMMRAHLTGYWEVRDIIRRHYFEETGHSDMMFDFLVNGLKVSRQKAYEVMNPSNFTKGHLEGWRKRREYCEKGHFVQVAAAFMLHERTLPKPNRALAVGLRKHYDIPDKHMTFFDVHSYIDIYHERFGKYILGKYATTKELQDLVRTMWQENMTSDFAKQKASWESMQASKK